MNITWLLTKRERLLIFLRHNHGTIVKEPKKTKTDEVLRQEEEARKEDKDHTELHDFYR